MHLDRQCKTTRSDVVQCVEQQSPGAVQRKMRARAKVLLLLLLKHRIRIRSKGKHRLLAVTGGGSIDECGRLSAQLLGRAIMQLVQRMVSHLSFIFIVRRGQSKTGLR